MHPTSCFVGTNVATGTSSVSFRFVSRTRENDLYSYVSMKSTFYRSSGMDPLRCHMLSSQTMASIRSVAVSMRHTKHSSMDRGISTRRFMDLRSNIGCVRPSQGEGRSIHQRIGNEVEMADPWIVARGILVCRGRSSSAPGCPLSSRDPSLGQPAEVAIGWKPGDDPRLCLRQTDQDSRAPTFTVTECA